MTSPGSKPPEIRRATRVQRSVRITTRLHACGRAAARAHGLDHRPAFLTRIRHTPMQDHRGLQDRFANQQGALAVPDRQRGAVEERAVLLVDDVMASGATLSVAAQALRDAGSGPVVVAVLTRALRDEAGARPAPGED